MLIRSVLGVILLMSGSLFACGEELSEVDENELVTTLSSEIAQSSGISIDDAQCIAQAQIRVVGAERMLELGYANPSSDIYQGSEVFLDLSRDSHNALFSYVYGSCLSLESLRLMIFAGLTSNNYECFKKSLLRDEFLDKEYDGASSDELYEEAVYGLLQSCSENPISVFLSLGFDKDISVCLSENITPEILSLALQSERLPEEQITKQIKVASSEVQLAYATCGIGPQPDIETENMASPTPVEAPTPVEVPTSITCSNLNMEAINNFDIDYDLTYFETTSISFPIPNGWGVIASEENQGNVKMTLLSNGTGFISINQAFTDSDYFRNATDEIRWNRVEAGIESTSFSIGNYGFVLCGKGFESGCGSGMSPTLLSIRNSIQLTQDKEAKFVFQEAIRGGQLFVPQTWRVSFFDGCGSGASTKWTDPDNENRYVTLNTGGSLGLWLNEDGSIDMDFVLPDLIELQYENVPGTIGAFSYRGFQQDGSERVGVWITNYWETGEITGFIIAELWEPNTMPESPYTSNFFVRTFSDLLANQARYE